MRKINRQKLSLGEGNTPLVRLFNIEKVLNWKGEIWAKAEYQNPTGSFKDRGSVAEIKEAFKQNKNGVVCASTGNMAASLAAYSAKTKLKCLVVIPNTTPEGKLQQARISGAQLIKVNGNYDLCVEKAKVIAKKDNLLLCGDYELRRSGQRSIGVELAQSGIRFDTYICPVGNGTVGCAVIEGFVSQNKLPRFIGVSGLGADPIVSAWKNNTSINKTDTPKTIASAMNVGNPLDGNLTLQWVKKTKGMMVSVTDTEIIAAQKSLSINEGIYVEKASSATVAALTKLPRLYKSLSIALILTGSGIKEK